MTNSDIFKLAHKLTKIAKREASLNREKFSYQVTFSFYLKDITNAQPMKYKVLTNVPEQNQVNKDCAMVGDYTKPETSVFAFGELFLLMLLILLNPFSLMIYNGLYLNLF